MSNLLIVNCNTHVIHLTKKLNMTFKIYTIVKVFKRRNKQHDKILTFKVIWEIHRLFFLDCWTNDLNQGRILQIWLFLRMERDLTSVFKLFSKNTIMLTVSFEDHIYSDVPKYNSSNNYSSKSYNTMIKNSTKWLRLDKNSTLKKFSLIRKVLK